MTRNQKTRAHLCSLCIKDGACLLWTGTMSAGTPRVRLNGGASRSARAAMWVASGRELEPGKVHAEPHCDARCLTPAHQRHITRKQIREESSRYSSGAAHSLARRRVVAVNAKLDRSSAMKLREIFAETGSYERAAEPFGVTRRHAYRVVKNKVWRETTPFSGLVA